VNAIIEESLGAYFLGGTLVPEGVDHSVTPPAPFQWVNARWRSPAMHYRVAGALVVTLADPLRVYLPLIARVP
jgi:hypothetical protein